LPRTVALLLTSAFLAVLLVLTLGGFYQPRAPVNLVPLKSIVHDLQAGGRHLVVNFLGNIVAFLPMGVLVPSLFGGRRPALRVAVASFVLSLMIELLQGVSGRRVADVDDVILNTVGGLIGYGLWQGSGRVGIPGRKTWRRNHEVRTVKNTADDPAPNSPPSPTNNFGAWPR
jgi:glycopeptide antibiotics resistance protein